MKELKKSLNKAVKNRDLLASVNILKQMGISQKKLCELSNVSYFTYIAYVNDKFILSEEKQDQILNTIKDLYL